MDQYRLPEAQQNMLAIARQPARIPSVIALRYFASYPREDVVPALVARIEAGKASTDLYDSVRKFIKSPAITAESKKKLSACIESGKGIRPRP